MWGGEKEEGGGFRLKKSKIISIHLLLYAHALHKISSSWLKWVSGFNTNKRSNRQVRGITPPMFYGIQSKVI